MAVPTEPALYYIDKLKDLYQNVFLKARKHYLLILDSILNEEVDEDTRYTLEDDNVDEFTKGHLLFMQLFTLVESVKTKASKSMADLLPIKSALGEAFQQLTRTCFLEGQKGYELVQMLLDTNNIFPREKEKVTSNCEGAYENTIGECVDQMEEAVKFFFFLAIEVPDDEIIVPGDTLEAEERVVDEVPEMILSNVVAQEDPGEMVEVAEKMAARVEQIRTYLDKKKAKMKVVSKALVKKIVTAGLRLVGKRRKLFRRKKRALFLATPTPSSKMTKWMVPTLSNHDPNIKKKDVTSQRDVPLLTKYGVETKKDVYKEYKQDLVKIVDDKEVFKEASWHGPECKDEVQLLCVSGGAAAAA